MVKQLTHQNQENAKIYEARFNHLEAALRNLEKQMGQISQQLSERPRGSLPSNTEKNPMESAWAIELRSGKILEEPIAKNLEQRQSEGHKEMSEEKDNTEDKVLLQTVAPSSKDGETTKSTPLIPYPERLVKKKKADTPQFSRFVEMLKKLHINLPFIDIVTQMPNYANFLKDILANKRTLEDGEIVKLNEECSAILQNKLPPKLKDPGSFTIPCQIGAVHFDKALCDLGASINLMPYSVFEKLGVGQVKNTMVSLQLADRSIKFARGIVENVLIKVGKFVFPADFIVLEMEEDIEVPIILGRPFLATARALIEVSKGTLVLRLGEEKVIFNVSNAMTYPNALRECQRIDTIDRGMKTIISEDPLLTGFGHTVRESIKDTMQHLDALKPWQIIPEPWPPPSQ